MVTVKEQEESKEAARRGILASNTPLIIMSDFNTVTTCTAASQNVKHAIQSKENVKLYWTTLKICLKLCREILCNYFDSIMSEHHSHSGSRH